MNQSLNATILVFGPFLLGAGAVVLWHLWRLGFVRLLAVVVQANALVWFAGLARRASDAAARRAIALIARNKPPLK